MSAVSFCFSSKIFCGFHNRVAESPLLNKKRAMGDSNRAFLSSKEIALGVSYIGHLNIHIV